LYTIVQYTEQKFQEIAPLCSSLKGKETDIQKSVRNDVVIFDHSPD